jgi:hypothetical protein
MDERDLVRRLLNRRQRRRATFTLSTTASVPANAQ